MSRVHRGRWESGSSHPFGEGKWHRRACALPDAGDHNRTRASITGRMEGAFADGYKMEGTWESGKASRGRREPSGEREWEGWWQFEKVTVGGVKRVPQSGGTGVGWRS